MSTAAAKITRLPAVPKLLISTFSHHKARSALTIAAIALSISLVVAVTSGYSSAEAALRQFVHYYLGAASIDISPKGNPHQVLPQSLVRDMAADPAIRVIVGRLEATVSVAIENAPSILGATAVATGVVLPDDSQIQSMKLEAGQWFEGAAGDVAVVDQVIAERANLKVGQTLTILHPERPLKLRVLGIVHKPVILALQTQSIYLPLQTFQSFLGRQNKVGRILIDLKPSADEDAFVQRWSPTVDAIEPVLRLRRASQRRQEMQKQLAGVEILSYMGGGIAMLAATFIVFATLSMGVAERSRTLAMLRAVGADRFQIGRLVVYEGVLLATMGAALGVPLGLLWMHILAKYHQAIFTAGPVLNIGGILFGAGGMILASILASFLPAWNAMRVSPLEALSPLGKTPRARSPWLAAIAGLLLISIDPIVCYMPNLSREFTFYGHFALGLPTLFFGFFLLAPACVWIVEHTVGHIVAFVLRLDYSLLRQQLSGSLWRSAGTAAALMVGLAALVVMQTQGTTALAGWRLPDKFPDVFIVAPFGLDQEQQKILETAPGIKPSQVLPIAIASPQLGIRLFSLGSTAFLPDATMFFGLDPDKAFDMIEFDYREGNAADAKRMLKLGQHIIVTNEFRQLKGLHVGDKLPLKTAMHGTVEYTIAAVVWSPGLDVIASGFDMGLQLEQRTVASVSGSIEDARRDFGIDRVNLFAANLQPGIEREELAAALSHRMDEPQTQPATAPASGGILPNTLNVLQIRRLLGKYGFLVGDVRHIKYHIQQNFQRLLMLLSSVALAAIAVASLGVTNTIMASIRGRQWQFGILRSIGVTRLQLLRMILAEAFLLAIVGCALGLAAGFLHFFDAHRITAILIGYTPPITIPWPMLWLGVGIIIFVALFAALFPAISAARTRPLDLLQSGRAAA
ncbi:MAG: ABC transporter permease [Planctomycetota bacterium]|nr:ABC transporter permease [Planctomycetota bacterium]